MAKKSESSEDSEELGCWLFIAIVCLAIGAGAMWGDGAGWMAAGGALLLFVLMGMLRRA